MASASVLKRLTQRAKEAEKIITELKATVDVLKQGAGIQIYTMYNNHIILNVSYPYWIKIWTMHGDFVYICMKLKERRVLNGHSVMFDT